MSSIRFRPVIGWFAFARLLGSHLTHSRYAFSATLSTPALNRRTLRWFEASPCRATPEDLPPSPAQHRFQRLIFYIGSSFSVHGTQSASKIGSRMDFAAAMITRSRTAGIESGLDLPGWPGLGMFTRRSARGR
jgi:hypothetical protein